MLSGKNKIGSNAVVRESGDLFLDILETVYISGKVKGRNAKVVTQIDCEGHNGKNAKLSQFGL